MAHTGRIHGHREVLDDTIFAKYLAQMIFFDISGQGFHYNLLEG
jgi:hypothetical protein